MNRHRSHAYTLLELLVVIVIAALLVGIAIPAFRGILSSSRRTLAESKLQQALYGARDAATASVGGGDAAAVFFFEPGKGIRVLTCIQVGSLAADSSDGSDEPRDIFVPMSGYEPVRLPLGLGVRGFALATANVSSSLWYETVPAVAGGPFSPAAGGRPMPGYWLFPETDYYARTSRLGAVGGDDPSRQTFMVRFTAREGTVSRNPTLALVVAPSDDADGARTTFASGTLDLADTDDLEQLVKRALSNVEGTEGDRSRVFGNVSPNTVLAGPVTEVALYEEKELARAVGARGLNQDSGSLYLPRSTAPIEPELDSTLFRSGGTDLRDIAELASLWIEGRLDPDVDPVPETGDSTARIFAVNTFFGDLVEINR